MQRTIPIAFTLEVTTNNFAKNNIPVIFYFNGTHADYHKPTDTVEKIRYDLLEQRTRLIFYAAWKLANRNERIVVDKQ